MTDDKHTQHAGCGHHHEHDGHDHHHAGGMHVHPVVKNMWVALALNLTFTCIEFVGGFLTNSVAILSDAVHDLGDSIAIVAAIVLEKYSHKKRTPEFTYGKRRFSILAAFFTSLILVVGSGFIISEAVQRFYHIEPVNSTGILWLSLLGIFFNGLAFLRLRKSSGNSLSQRAVSLHLLEDVLGWICVLAGSIIMYFTNWYWIDPLLSLGIAAYILFNAVKNITSALRIFLQSVPKGFDEILLKDKIVALEPVIKIHDMHCWTMDGEFHVISLHVVVKQDFQKENWYALRTEVLEIITSQGIQHATIQMESEEESCALVNC